MCCRTEWFTYIKLLNINISAINSTVKTKGVGDIKFNFRFQMLILYDMLYVLDIKINAISIQYLIQDNDVGYTSCQGNGT
jgi:hypothetical protein